MDYIGACRYCGQICSMATQEFKSQEEADDYATMMCHCDQALGFDPVNVDVLAVLDQAIYAVGIYAVKDVSITLPSGDKGKISRSKDAIRVTRSRGIVRSLDA